jgi:DNA modification methylase
MGDVEVIQGDCLAVMGGMEAGSVDCIVTDPPYGVGKAEWDGEFPTDWISFGWRVSPRMLVMPGNRSLILAANAIGRYRDCLCLRSLNGMTRSPIAFGKWIPVLVCGEWKWMPKPNVMEFSVKEEKFNHPSIKPLQAMLRLIETFTEPGWTILDPFAGSGTTGVACMKTGRRCILIEENPKYIPIIHRRLAAASTPLFDLIPAGGPTP